MAQIGNVYQTETTDQSHTGNLTYTTKFTVLGSAFEASTVYLMLLQAQVGGDAGNGRFKFRTRIGTFTPEGSEMIMEPVFSTQEARNPYVFLHKFTTAASPDDVTFQIAPQQNTGDKAHADTITLFAIKLDDLDSTDWFYGEDTTDGDHTIGSTWGDEASITFTPGNAGDDWLIIAWGSVHIGSTVKQWRYRIDFDNATSLEPLHSQEGEDTAEEKPWTLMRPYNLDASEHTFKVQSNDATGGGVNQHNISKIFALRLQAFEDVVTFWDGGTFNTPDGNWNEIADMAFTASTTGNGLVLGSCVGSTGAGSGTQSSIRTQIGGVTKPTGKDVGHTDQATYDDDDLPFLPVLTRFAITADATVDVDVDAKVLSLAQDILDRGFVAFSLELAAVGGVNVATPLKAFTLAGQVPVIITAVFVDAPVKSFTLAGQVPAVGTGATVIAPLGSFTLSGKVPLIVAGVDVEPPLGTFTFTGQVPLVASGGGANVPLKTFTLTGLAPQLGLGHPRRRRTINKGSLLVMSLKMGRYSRTVVQGGGVVDLGGGELISYSLQTDGNNNATLNVRRLTSGATVIWTDICIAEDLAKSFPLAMEEPDGHLFVEVTGTGATCDFSYN